MTRSLLLIVAATLFAVGCDGIDPTTSNEEATLYTPSGPVVRSQSAAAPEDPNIVTDDTYVTAQVTIE